MSKKVVKLGRDSLAVIMNALGNAVNDSKKDAVDLQALMQRAIRPGEVEALEQAQKVVRETTIAYLAVGAVRDDPEVTEVVFQCTGEPTLVSQLFPEGEG